MYARKAHPKHRNKNNIPEPNQTKTTGYLIYQKHNTYEKPPFWKVKPTMKH